MRKIIFTILCLFTISMVVGIACASDANNITTNETDLDDSLAVDENVNVTNCGFVNNTATYCGAIYFNCDGDVNDTVSANNSTENDTEVIDANQTQTNNNNNIPQLNITGPKDHYKLDIQSPFPYNLRDNPKYQEYIEYWSEEYAIDLKYYNPEVAYGTLIHDYVFDFLMYDDNIYQEIKYDIKPYAGIIYLVVNAHKSLKNPISISKITNDIFNEMDLWAEIDDAMWYTH